MKKLLLLLTLLSLPKILMAQDDRPKTTVDGIEFKIAKCEGDLTTKSIRVQFIFTNVGEFDRKAGFSQLLLTGPDGERFIPLDKHTAYLFESARSTVELRTNIPAKTRVIEIRDVSPSIKYFSEVSVNQFYGVKIRDAGADRRAMAIKQVPIEWK